MFGKPPSPSQHHTIAIAHQVQIPKGIDELVDETWQFQNNWGWKDVKLQHGSKATILDVSQLFKPLEGEFLKPPMRAADAEVGPGDSISQVAHASSVSSNAGSEAPKEPPLT